MKPSVGVLGMFSKTKIFGSSWVNSCFSSTGHFDKWPVELNMTKTHILADLSFTAQCGFIFSSLLLK